MTYRLRTLKTLKATLGFKNSAHGQYHQSQQRQRCDPSIHSCRTVPECITLAFFFLFFFFRSWGPNPGPCAC
ncbi:rCG26703 [Rattus norvegicus]|uniref:RCG26703 n=1 Tax=Rattus norvegicus TaxID=10116 RepID=A6HLY3_RAT|nr:rCG26703 [Rattus norvegicus]